MKNKYGLRQMDWPDLITHFVLLEDKEDFSAKDLVDYFHFHYLDAIELGRWTMPDYRRQKRSAEKVLEIYGKEDSINLVKILFKEYNNIIGRPFGQIQWSLGLLSSDKCGQIAHDALMHVKREKSNKPKDRVGTLLKKPRSEWTPAEMQEFEELIKNEI